MLNIKICFLPIPPQSILKKVRAAVLMVVMNIPEFSMLEENDVAIRFPQDALEHRDEIKVLIEISGLAMEEGACEKLKRGIWETLKKLTPEANCKL